jgi:predicted CXXCH cytochrome family protein
MTIRSLLAGCLLQLFLCAPLSAGPSGEIDCLKCHAKLKQQKVVHAAMEMGCPSCHTSIDASKVPHKKTGTFPNGLSAEQPDLCYGCHDRADFSKKYVHTAIGMGCTACHNPHSSKQPKLLSADPPELCFSCHDRSSFSKQVVHAPVAAGMCLTCHSAHSAENVALLVKKPYDLCLDCHGEVPTKPHAVAGFGSARHPLGETKKARKSGAEQETKDPSRPDRAFYCGSCHEPHSSAGGRLFRFNAKASMSLCSNCHQR